MKEEFKRWGRLPWCCIFRTGCPKYSKALRRNGFDVAESCKSCASEVCKARSDFARPGLACSQSGEFMRHLRCLYLCDMAFTDAFFIQVLVTGSLADSTLGRSFSKALQILFLGRRSLIVGCYSTGIRRDCVGNYRGGRRKLCCMSSYFVRQKGKLKLTFLSDCFWYCLSPLFPSSCSISRTATLQIDRLVFDISLYQRRSTY